MSRTLTIDPVTRIEGHAQVHIDIGDDGKVAAATMHVLEFRGFERFEAFTYTSGARMISNIAVSFSFGSACFLFRNVRFG